MKEISSTKNSLIKETVLLLEKARLRKEKGMFVCEGLNEINLLLIGKYNIEHLFYCPEIISAVELFHSLPGLEKVAEPVQVTEAVMQKIAYRGSVKNAVVVAQSKTHALEDIKLLHDSFILVIEKVEKPGNLGAILRTADAAGLNAVIICDEACDLYNPNAIRSSVGCTFTGNVAIASVEKTLDFLRENQFKIFTTLMKNARSIYDQDLTGNSAMIFGTESTGLSIQWEIPEAININIPMFGKVDSLNVSNAAAIMAFEGIRQRKFSR